MTQPTSDNLAAFAAACKEAADDRHIPAVEIAGVILHGEGGNHVITAADAAAIECAIRQGNLHRLANAHVAQAVRRLGGEKVEQEKVESRAGGLPEEERARLMAEFSQAVQALGAIIEHLANTVAALGGVAENLQSQTPITHGA